MALMAVYVSEGAQKKKAKVEAVKPSPDQILIEKGKDVIKNLLKDPESAQFRNVHIKPGTDWVVQGEVNAKNSYGAYIGFDKWFYDSKEKEFAFEASTIKTLKEGMDLLGGRVFDNDAPNDKDSNLTRTMKACSRANRDLQAKYKVMFVEGW